jgi:hypothetical protein
MERSEANQGITIPSITGTRSGMIMGVCPKIPEIKCATFKLIGLVDALDAQPTYQATKMFIIPILQTPDLMKLDLHLSPLGGE